MTTQQATSGRNVFWNVDKWIEANKNSFLPPVCNKMMHKEGQLKVMYIGGPNVRKDYHLEEGEELFYMVKGDMVLKVFEHNKPKDIPIKQGEIFLLPSNVNHSPQRFADTVGLVIERERTRDKEIDGLRFFVEENGETSANPLYEAWFYCEDLGSQIAPVINGFLASEQYKTGRPIPGTVCDGSSPLPCSVNTELTIDSAFNLQEWLHSNDEEIRNKGKKALFDEVKWQSKVVVYGPGSYSDCKPNIEVFCWQLDGTTEVTLAGTKYTLHKDDSVLIEAGKPFTVNGVDGNSRCLVYYQDPAAKK